MKEHHKSKIPARGTQWSRSRMVNGRPWRGGEEEGDEGREDETEKRREGNRADGRKGRELV